MANLATRNTTMEYQILLGKQIREIREERSISQENLAYKAGLDRSYYGSIERGERNITFQTLIKIAQALDCGISDFTKNLPK